MSRFARRLQRTKQQVATSGEFIPNLVNNPHLGGYPDETNTGVPTGEVLTLVPQEATEGPGWWWREDIRALVIDTEGAVIENFRIENAMIIVYEANVTIRNVYLSSSNYYPINCAYGGATREANSCLGLLVEDTEIAGIDGPNCGMCYSGYTARRVYIHGCQDGFKADKDVVIEDCYVANLFYWEDEDGNSTHNDAVQTTGGYNVTLRHNTFKIGDIVGANAVCQFGTEDYPTITNWLIEDNICDGGGWTFNSNPDVTNSIVRNNRFTHRYQYGIAEMPEATWSGNIWDDTGEPLSAADWGA